MIKNRHYAVQGHSRSPSRN